MRSNLIKTKLAILILYNVQDLTTSITGYLGVTFPLANKITAAEILVNSLDMCLFFVDKPKCSKWVFFSKQVIAKCMFNAKCMFFRKNLTSS